jgi:hypothetical protein
VLDEKTVQHIWGDFDAFRRVAGEEGRATEKKND